jgi:hypothetical protein
VESLNGRIQQLKTNARGFRAIAQAGGGATVTFAVYADEKKIFDSGLLKDLQTAPIDLRLEEVQDLKLVVTDGGNGKHGDHASWVDAHLSGR